MKNADPFQITSIHTNSSVVQSTVEFRFPSYTLKNRRMKKKIVSKGTKKMRSRKALFEKPT